MACVLGAVDFFPSNQTLTMPGHSAPVRNNVFAPEPQLFSSLYDGADPWVTRQGNTWFSCNVRRNGSIEVWKSTTFAQRGTPKTVWTPPRRAWNSAEVWAPELHHLNNRWFIYYAASDGKNANHRMGVLAATTDDPQGPYEDLGPLYTGDDIATKTDNRRAIDGTPFQHNGQLYFLWSGWQDHRDIQHLYIAKMGDPATITTSRQRLAPNDCHAWERVSEDPTRRGLHEGPALLRRHGRIHLIYSCSGSWEHTYKLGLLHMPLWADPMRAESWTKHPTPIFAPTKDHFGVGHCSFTTDEQGNDVMFYHAKKSRRVGWDRTVHAQRFTWSAEGFPQFAAPEHTTITPAPRRAA